ncbi:beta-glucuronidase [Aureococcus anophagefferens]|nr:beta-glucuronidase [Aureococcus anophagefferens]
MTGWVARAAGARRGAAAVERLQEVLSGLAGGAAQRIAKDVVLFPIDTVKVRLQTAGNRALTRRAFARPYSGVLAPLVVGVPAASLFFGVKDGLAAYARNAGVADEFALEALTVALANGPYWAASAPSELLKTAAARGGPEGLASLARRIYDEAGLAGFYAGAVESYSYAVPADVVKFSAYRFLKRRYAVGGGDAVLRKALLGAALRAIMLYPKQSQTRCVLDLNGIWDLAREHEKCGQEDGFEAEKVAVPCSYNDLYAEEGFRMWSGGRNVCLYTTSPDGWISDIRVVTTIDGATGRVSIEGAVDGAGGIGDTIHITVDGATTAAILDPADAGNSRRFNVDLVIEDCKFWGVGAPNLYGFGRHEDFPIVGKGLCHGVNVRDHELLKWINANSYRTTHYPYSEELVALADEQGILLIAEAPAVSINFDFVTPRTLENHRAALRELIERDRNAPSVIMWSVANEATTNRPEARPYFSELAADARSLDGTRPVTMVTCKVEDDAVVDLFDVRDNMRAALSALHAKCGKPIFVSEFGADALAGMHALTAEQWSEEYQADLIMELISVFRELDFVVGEHVWNFADFRTAQNFPRVGGNKKGVFTRDRQPKMAAHFLKRQWATPRY